MQTSLFEMQEPKVKKSLIISTKKQRPLNKQQQAFNRLVKKIEKLRIELEKTSKDLDSKLSYYVKHIHPLEEQLTTMRKEVVKLLFPFYANKNQLKQHKNTLKQFLALQLQQIFGGDDEEPDEELAGIFEAVNGISYEDAATREFEEMKDEMEEMFGDFGFDVDLGEINKDMSNEEMVEKLKNLQEEFSKEEESNNYRKASAKKTARQLKDEAREQKLEEARSKNISSIYKQLAKALHPDLEQDEHLKIQKETLMKRLTVAYNNNDLHSILSLEMEWIQKEEQNRNELSNEKLSIYNLVLTEQVQDLEQQLAALHVHPRFQPLARYSISPFDTLNINLPKEKKGLEDILNTLKVSITNLKGKEGLKEVKNIINAVKYYAVEEDLLDEIIYW